MSDDKKNVFSLVSAAVNQAQVAKDKIKALHQPHLEEMFAQFEAGTHRYIVVSVDDTGFASFLTDMDAYQANFEIDKVKFSIMLPASDDIEE